MVSIASPERSGRGVSVDGVADACTVTFELGSSTTVRVGLRPRSVGHWTVGELTVTSRTDPTGLNSEDVRNLPLGTLLAEARRLATRTFTERPAQGSALEAIVAGRGMRLPRSDYVLAAVAEEYGHLVANGDRSPAQSLAQRFGGTPGTWTNRITAARRSGFLGEAVQGEAGGALTPAGASVLAAGDPDSIRER